MVRQPILILLICAFFLPIITFSQNSVGLEQPDINYRKAQAFYDEGRYGSAREYFALAMESMKSSSTNLSSEAEYYHAQCSKLLGNDDAENLFKDFLEHCPESGKIQYAYFRLGEINGDNNKFRQAIRWYQKVKPANLDEKSRYVYYFKSGYANFACENDDEAIAQFSKIKDNGGEYQSAANYYYSHIQYTKGNYQTALNGFLKLKTDPAFKEVIPYYVAQIYFLQKEYDKAIEFGLPLLDNSTNARKPEIARVVGGSYYQKGNYAQAVKYLQMVISWPGAATREDYFHLGYAYYSSKDYTKAAENLSLVTSEQDIMSQTAYFYLGDCYIKAGDKKRARVAFEAASKLNYDIKIQEEALFTTIKLNYELSYSPFNEIITSFTNFINLFPKSNKIDEAYDYLSKTFLSTKNYPMAIESLEKIGNKDASIYKSIQRVAYYRGLQLFNDMELADAVKMFDYSLKYPDYNKSLKVKAYYWRAEAKYKLGDNNGAVEDYKTFIQTPGSFNLPEFSIAHYNIGYAYFNQKDYAGAKEWFRKYFTVAPMASSPITGDAYNRLGDCYFADRDFDMALDCYNKSISNGLSMPDYALFQKGLALGISKKHQAKIDALNELINKYPKSSYVDDALFESARSYIELNNLAESIKRYKTIKEKYPQSSYAKKSLQQLGLVYYNSGDFDNSLQYFKRVVNEYPGTPESDEALAGIRNIYIDKGDLNGYYAYTKTLGNFVKIEVNEEDSLTYLSAEKSYMAGNCENAIRNFENYLGKFSDGKYSLNAHYYKADCLYKKGDKEGAYNDYKVVLARGKNDFTEEALVNSADYLYEEVNYQDALPLYKRIITESDVEENRATGRIGEMRCLFHLNIDDEAIESADKVLTLSKLEPEIAREAKFTKANSYRNLLKTDLAFDGYKELSANVNSVVGSESKYWVCQMLFDKTQYDKAETEIFDFAKKGTPHQYWLARCFVLLSDIYILRNENFQAKQYLESVKENYKGKDDILDMVNVRLIKITDAQPKPKPKTNFSLD